MFIKDIFFGVKKLCFFIIYRIDIFGKVYKYCINLLFFFRLWLFVFIIVKRVCGIIGIIDLG